MCRVSAELIESKIFLDVSTLANSWPRALLKTGIFTDEENPTVAGS
jgi:hypothetical protein